MPKHNNPIPDAHFHKQWQRRVKTWFDQAPKAAKRKAARVEKARRIFPRPTAGPLRPVVQCPSIRYNMRARLGRGFSLEELKAAKVNRHEALTIGIAVDHRRRNRSEEAFERNVARLVEYKSKLILFPRNPAKPHKRDATPEQVKAATQLTGPILGTFATRASTAFESRAITDEDRRAAAFWTLRRTRIYANALGKRIKKKAQIKADKASGKVPEKKPKQTGEKKKPSAKRPKKAPAKNTTKGE